VCRYLLSRRQEHRIGQERAEGVVDGWSLPAIMGENFTDIWHSDRCPPTLKKMIFRTAIEEIIERNDEENKTLQFIIWWKRVRALRRRSKSFGQRLGRSGTSDAESTNRPLASNAR
jgi:hypothetical protein